MIEFRDGYTCQCVATSLPWVEWDMRRLGLISNHIDIYQYGYRLTDPIQDHPTGDSMGTHNGGGCTDVAQFHDRQIAVWRRWGWTMQDRSPFFAFDHGHGWPYKCPHLSEAAQGQEDDWNRKDAGLKGTGQVQGPWPVKPWPIALREQKMSIASEIADAVAVKLSGNRKFLDAVADSVLQRDGQIPNTFTGNPANKYVALATAVGVLGERSKSS